MKELVRILLAFVFIIAGILRAFYPFIGKKEESEIYSVKHGHIVIMILEIIGGILLLIGVYVNIVLWVFFVMVGFGTLMVILRHWKKLKVEWYQIGAYQVHILSVILHIVFLILILGLLIKND